MLRNLLLGFFCFGMLTLNSCGSFGSKPNKIITVDLELQAANLSEENINKAIKAIKNRFEKFGVYPEIEKASNSNILKFSLETDAPEDRILKFLRIPGNLEFYLVHKPEALSSFMLGADELLKENDSLKAGPLFRNILDDWMSTGPTIIAVAEKDTAAINSHLRNKRVLDLLPADLGRTSFLWGRLKGTMDKYELYAIATNSGGRPPLDGSVITRTRSSLGYADNPVIDLQMNAEGSRIWEELTLEAYQNAQSIAIVIDDLVVSAPGVLNGPISGGHSQISGDFTEEEAQDLAVSIGAGRIPKMKILSHSVVSLE